VVVSEDQRLAGPGRTTIGIDQPLTNAQLEFLGREITKAEVDADVKGPEVLVVTAGAREAHFPVTRFKLGTGKSREREQREDGDEIQLPQHVYLLRWKAKPRVRASDRCAFARRVGRFAPGRCGSG